MKQPATVSYFFRQGYVDLLNVIKGAWRKNNESASAYLEELSDVSDSAASGFMKFFLFFYYVFAVISMYLIGTIVYIAVSLVHIAILLVLMLVVYVLFSLLWIVDKLYLAGNRIFGACPRCKEKFAMPIYLCPKCNAQHTRLVPGKYGILKRTCAGEEGKPFCGEKLPTTFFNGRRNLASICPVQGCGHRMGAKEAVPVCIPVIGGTSVGKTTFITALMKELTEKIAPSLSLEVEFYDERNKIECNRMIEKYNKGGLQMKTASLNPSAYNFFLKGKFLFPPRLMYLYDIAGEAFFTPGALPTQKQYYYSHGVIFLIDPLSIPQVKKRYQDREGYSKHGASSNYLDDTFDTFLNNFKRVANLPDEGLSRVPCAIVINKTDVYDLEEEIGFKAAAMRLHNVTQKGAKPKSLEDALSMVARDFLEENGMSNFVAKVETAFKKTKYFTCSSLGHVHEGKGFYPVRVFMPIKWIISNFDKTLYYNLRRYDVTQAEGNRDSAAV